MAESKLPFYFAIQFSAHLSSSSTLTGFLPSSQQRDWQSWEGLCRPNFLQPWRQRGKPGADSGQTHAQMLVYSPACEGGTSQSWARWARQDALRGRCPLQTLRVFSSELAQNWELSCHHRVLPLTLVTVPFVVTLLIMQGSLLLKPLGTPLIFPAPRECTQC